MRYRRNLLGLMKELRIRIRKEVFPKLEALTGAFDVITPGERRDGAGEDLEAILLLLRNVIAGVFSERSVLGLVRDALADVSTFNKRQVQKQVMAVLGITLPPEAFLGPVMQAAVADNVGLIGGLTDELRKGIGNVITRGVRAGRRHTALIPEIVERLGVSESRARLIARDQVLSFNGELTRLRQQNVGVTRYRWLTLDDGKARDEHIANNGQIFSWDNAPDTGHPTEAVNCRCQAQPIFSDITL